MRIGVNIPDDLLRRLDPLKSELNISEVCREALAKRVQGYETAIINLEDGSASEVLERAAGEEIEHWKNIDFDWEALGYEDAVNWVASATWKDWETRREAQGLLERQNRPSWEIHQFLRGDRERGNKTFDDRFRDFYEFRRGLSDEYLDWLYYNGIETDWDAARRDYGRAWVVYLGKAWAIICERRNTELERLRQQLIEDRRNRPQPSIPDHLFPGDERIT